MSLQYPSAPRPPRAADGVYRWVCAVIGAVALAAVIVVAVATGDDAKAGSPLGPGDGQQLGNSGGRGGVSVNGGASSGNGGGASTRTAVTAAYLDDHFPLPSGQASVRVGESPTGAKTYQLKGTLDSLRTFYTDALGRLGVRWSAASPTRGGDGRIVGYFAALTITTAPYDLGSMQLLVENPAGHRLPSGQVDMEVKLQK